jgi:death-on-curing protein
VTTYLSSEILLEQLESIGFVVRDRGLFASCVDRPAKTLYGEDTYPTLELKAASLLESFVKNHPMIDGNKRSAWLSTNIFLELNGVEIYAAQEAAFDFILSIATGSKSLDELAQWLSSNTRPLG